MTEDDLLRAVLDLCQYRGALTFHARPARTAKGWRTPVMGNGAGFPDLVIVGTCGVLYRELKTNEGRVSAAQRLWLQRLRDAEMDADIWRPRDLEQGVVLAALKRISRKES
jgi:hypothetical protein